MMTYEIDVVKMAALAVIVVIFIICVALVYFDKTPKH